MLVSIAEGKFISFNFQRLKIIVLITIVLLFSIPGATAQAVYEPGRGSPERKAILDTVRPLVEARLGPPVEFVVGWMRAGFGWAFVQVNPQRPGGGAIDLRNTVYAGQRDFMDGLTTYALLFYQYDRWNLVDFVVGPTDVFWVGEPLFAQLPQGLTPY